MNGAGAASIAITRAVAFRDGFNKVIMCDQDRCCL